MKRCEKHTERTPDGRRCLGCKWAQEARWRARNKVKISSKSRKSTLKRFYGVTEEWFEATLKAQDEACAICSTKDPGKKGWHIDHDHESKKVRGLLCSFCNTKCVPTLERALVEQTRLYLQKHGRI